MIHEPDRYSWNVYRCIKFLHIIWKPSLCTRHRLSFCNVKHRLRRRAKRKSEPFLRVVFSFFPTFFCLIVSRYLDEATEQLNAGVVQNFGEESENHCTVKKKKKKRNGKSVALNKSPLVWRIKTYLWKERVCLVSLDSGCLYSAALVLNQSGLHRCPCQSSGAPPWGPGVSDSVTAATHSFSFPSMAAGSFRIEQRTAESCTASQTVMGGDCTEYYGVFYSSKNGAAKKKKKNYKWHKLNSTGWWWWGEGGWLMFSFLSKMMNYKATVDLSILQPRFPSRLPLGE